jgi:hypothetical protein
LVRVALARLSLKGLKHATSGALDHRAWLSADERALGGSDDVMICAQMHVSRTLGHLTPVRPTG